MASKKTSEENVLTKSGFNANTVMRLADGSTNDNYQIGCLDFINAITLTSAQAITLLGTPSDVVLDSMYKITTLSKSGLDYVIISGRNMITGGKAECYITALARTVECQYKTSTNVIDFDYLIWAGHVSQAGGAAPSVDDTSYNISGETPTFGYTAVGDYTITVTGDKFVSMNAVKHYSSIYDATTDGFVIVEGVDANTALIKCYRGGALEDDRLMSVYIEIRLVYTL